MSLGNMSDVIIIIVKIFFMITCVLAVKESLDDLKQCKYGDTECIKNDINFILENKKNGYPEYQIPSLNPVKVKLIEINQPQNKNIYLNLKYVDNNLNFADNMRVYKIKGFNKDLKGQHEIYMKGSSLTLNGPYESTGKMLLTDLTGRGNHNLTIVDVDLKIIMTGKSVNKNEKEYMNIDRLKLSFDISRMYAHFDNLIGDSTINQAFNEFIDENWKEMFEELKPLYFDAFGKIAKTIINNVFDKYPYDEFFDN